MEQPPCSISRHLLRSGSAREGWRRWGPASLQRLSSTSDWDHGIQMPEQLGEDGWCHPAVAAAAEKDSYSQQELMWSIQIHGFISEGARGHQSSFFFFFFLENNYL